jgi:D-arabinose 1-dehydrogenase-like Zn-dependent alcohol dehydrogenase
MGIVKTLHCFGAGNVSEVDWEMPAIGFDQIKIKTAYCGVCRSDIGNYTGAEKMPYSDEFHPNGKIGTWGHEAIGTVVEVGPGLRGKVNVGDFVSTWSDPGYAEYYYAKENEFVVIPELHHKYILQPVACALNIFQNTEVTSYVMGFSQDEPILLLGSGFMSLVIGSYCKTFTKKLIVVGNSNKDLWEWMGYELHSLDEILASGKKYNIVIDLTSKSEMFDIISKKLADLEALVCYAATPFTPVTTNFFDTCWNCHTLIFPSPRNSSFNAAMVMARDLIETDSLGIVNKIWSAGYDRHDMAQVKKAFDDGSSRIPGYLRGYLKF